jgi:RimJ/RimL family protein N-acetyltransferase
MNLVFNMFQGEPDWGIQSDIEGLSKYVRTRGIIAVDTDTNSVAAACTMENWTPTSVHAHLTVVNPAVLRHGFFECVYNYIFNVRGVSRVYGMVPSNNTKAIKLNTHMGFTVKATLEEAFAVGVDYLLMELTRANCSFIEQPTEEKAA